MTNICLLLRTIVFLLYLVVYIRTTNREHKIEKEGNPNKQTDRWILGMILFFISGCIAVDIFAYIFCNLGFHDTE